jgi:hypothetical protein
MLEMEQRHVQLRSQIIEEYLVALSGEQDNESVAEWLRNMDNWCASHAINENSVARFMIQNYYAEDKYPLLMKWMVEKDSTTPFGEWLFFFEKLYFYLRGRFPLLQDEERNIKIAAYGLEIALSRFEITDELDEVLHALLNDSVYNLRDNPREYVTRLVNELALQKRVWQSRVQPGAPRVKRSLPDPALEIPEGVKRIRTRKQREGFEYY